MPNFNHSFNLSIWDCQNVCQKSKKVCSLVVVELKTPGIKLNKWYTIKDSKFVWWSSIFTFKIKNKCDWFDNSSYACTAENYMI